MENNTDLILVGMDGEEHIGTHLRCAAKEIGLRTEFFSIAEAFGNRTLMNRLRWRLNGHRPVRMREFGGKILRACKESGARWLLATGLAPLEEEMLEAAGKLPIHRINYLTDDPWNPAHRAPWFFRALKSYDDVFSTRRSNLEDLRRAGCAGASYLPFAYAPEIHYPVSLESPKDRARFSIDVLFVGGADRDRLPFVRALLREGFPMALYGGSWGKDPRTRPYWKGYAPSEIFRKAVAGAKISLCLVRRANRDGNSMRTFEIPAMKGCVLAEDTPEHREIFGEEGEAACFFGTPKEAVEKTCWLLAHENERLRMAGRSFEQITQGRNTYQDRLREMLRLPSEGS